MKPGDLVKYKNGEVYLVAQTREIDGEVAYVHLDGFPDHQVFKPRDLEVVNAPTR
jgi:hypothetical protein